MIPLVSSVFRWVFPQEDAADIKREYHLPEVMNFSLRVTGDGWFVLTMPDHPGLITQAKSQDNLLEMVNDAILTYYDVPKRKADIVYDRLAIGDTVIQYQGQLQTQQT